MEQKKMKTMYAFESTSKYSVSLKVKLDHFYEQIYCISSLGNLLAMTTI